MNIERAWGVIVQRPDANLAVEDQIVVAIRRIVRALELHSRRLVEEYGLTGPQLAVLQAAAGMEEPSTTSLARALHLSSPTVTGILDRLAKRGLIERLRDVRDRRSVLVRLTPQGHDMLAAAPSLLQERFRAELSALQDWEQSMILATLQRIAAMMDAEGLDADAVLLSATGEAVTDGAKAVAVTGAEHLASQTDSH